MDVTQLAKAMWPASCQDDWVSIFLSIIPILVWQSCLKIWSLFLFRTRECTTNCYLYSGCHWKINACNKSLCKWGHFEKAKTTFKMLLATWFLVCFFKRFRSFVAENLESVGQRAAKLPAIKLWEWFEGAGVRTRAHWLTGAGAGWQTFLETSNFDS